MTQIFLIIAGISLISCSVATDTPRGRKSEPVVFVTNYPLQYFAQRIGGSLIDVRFPAPADVDPAYWEPDPATIEAYQTADLILLNGASYEKWVERTSLPPSKVTDTSASFKQQYMALEESLTHSHGPGGKHSHSGTAFTTWLDPVLAWEQAKSVRDALRKLLPAEAGLLDGNLEALVADLRSINDQLQASRGALLIASHPVYQYVARRYDWNLKSLHWEPNEQPSAEEWRKLDTILKAHRAKVMIWEAPPQAETEQRLKKLGIRPVVFYTCANTTNQGDYLSIMRQNADRLK